MRSLVVVLLLSLATSARAQSSTADPVDVLLGTHAVLHLADMVTTGWSLSHPAPTLAVHESNPLLRPFEQHPAWLAAANGAFVVAEVVAVKRIERDHPTVARAVAITLVVVKTWAVISNIRVMGQLQEARRAGGGSDGR